MKEEKQKPMPDANDHIVTSNHLLMSPSNLLSCLYLRDRILFLIVCQSDVPDSPSVSRISHASTHFALAKYGEPSFEKLFSSALHPV